ncbi:MAG: hypothetical protein OJF52_001172 [Nitrospira sp.]|jgi:integrase|nr:MAG: hypothetical protein OJF52_001172 [Nitrospira sp.]
MARQRNNRKRRLQPNFIKQQFGFFKRMLTEAVGRKLIPIHPAADLRAIGGRRRKCAARPIEATDTLTEAELEVLLTWALDVLPPRIYVLICLMALAGLRLGEARALHRTDLELDYRHPKDGRQPRLFVRRTERLGELGPPKYGSSRYVPVVPLLEAVLREWIGRLPPNTIWVLPARLPRVGSKRRESFRASGQDPNAGWCIAEETFRYHWNKLMRVVPLGRQLPPKSLRHAFCTIALNQGETLEWVSTHMGHRDCVVTQTVYGLWANPPGLGVFAEWIVTQNLPVTSHFGQPEAVEILEALGVPSTTIAKYCARLAPAPPAPLTMTAEMDGPDTCGVEPPSPHPFVL